ncbi:hypothetical protein T4E_1116 [Trichinella pseudospiralis]|uniref:Uncharacterized protein n=1 Tax=Trichinella pseudospiralis TaxID=6337 RepID=A0A0V0XYF7_TRIPS|nr:hypothetical protein T4E_1116 [Trichinella pseudospiralis]KRY84398.1 hypothetical protein T4D_11847 [Trichinella pseudospiralis]
MNGDEVWQRVKEKSTSWLATVASASTTTKLRASRRVNRQSKMT